MFSQPEAIVAASRFWGTPTWLNKQMHSTAA